MSTNVRIPQHTHTAHAHSVRCLEHFRINFIWQLLFELFISGFAYCISLVTKHRLQLIVRERERKKEKKWRHFHLLLFCVGKHKLLLSGLPFYFSQFLFNLFVCAVCVFVCVAHFLILLKTNEQNRKITIVHGSQFFFGVSLAEPCLVYLWVL